MTLLLHDKYDFLDGLKVRPETLKTFLCEDYPEQGMIRSCLEIAKRKVQTLVGDGLMFQYQLDGDWHGTQLMFHPEKEYYVVIVQHDRSRWSYYYAASVVEDEKESVLVLSDAYELSGKYWLPVGVKRVELWKVVRCF